MIYRDSLFSALIRAGGLGLSLLVNVVMARLLLPDGYGLYAFILASVTILTIPASFGLPTLLVRETARAMADNDTAQVWQVWHWGQRFVLITSAGAVAVGIPWFLFNAKADDWRAWAWGGLLIPVLALAYLRSAAIRGLGHLQLGQLPEAILRPGAVTLIALAIAALFGAGLSVEQAMFANFVGTTFAFLVGLAVLWYLAPLRPAAAHPPVAGSHRDWLVAALTMGMATGVQNLGANADVMFLGVLRSGAEVALYKVALNGASLVGFGMQAVNMVLMPRIPALHRAGDITALATTVRQAARIVFVMTLGAVVLLSIFGGWLITTLFSNAYADAYGTLLIIGFGQAMSAIFGSVMVVLSMTGHEKKALLGVVGFAVANLLLNAVLVPLAGKEGAAIATAASLIFFNFHLWIVVRRTLGINTMVFGR